jgi:hypothetical protein
MLTTFALHPAASKALIARATTLLPQVQSALRQGKIFIGHGTTNVAVAESLLQRKITSPEQYVAGVISGQVACMTNPAARQQPFCLHNGVPVETDWLDFVRSLQSGDIFIKGANAVDAFGRVGILMANEYGGTIGQSFGLLRARGIEIIVPVGLEKMIPSCTEAGKGMGINKTGIRLGLPVGYMVLDDITLVTEIESLKIIYGIDAVMVGAGGVGGMEGSVILAANCQNEQQAHHLLRDIRALNQLKQLNINKRLCKDCTNPCDFITRV